MALTKLQKFAITAPPVKVALVLSAMFITIFAVVMTIFSTDSKSLSDFILLLCITLAIGGPLHFLILKQSIARGRSRLDEQLGRQLTPDERLDLTMWSKGGPKPTDRELQGILPRYVEYHEAVATGRQVLYGSSKQQKFVIGFLILVVISNVLIAITSHERIHFSTVIASLFIAFLIAFSWPSKNNGNWLFRHLNKKAIQRGEEMKRQL